MPARSSASESPRVVRCLLAVLALVLLVGPASAQITDIQPVEPLDFEEDLEFPWLLVGVTGFAGASGVAMDDLNEAVRLLNLEIAAQGSEGISYDSFGSVVSLGTGIRAIVLKRWVVQTDFERLIRSAQVGGVTSNSEIRIPANVITTSLSFDLLAKQTLGMGAGLGLAWYSSRAEQVVRRTRPGQDEEELGRVKLEGSAVGPVFQGYFEAKFTDRIYVNVTGGYRIAKMKDADISGVTELEEAVADANADADFIFVPVAECTNCDEMEEPPPGEEEPEPVPAELALRGGGSDLDWSGLWGRVALTVYVNMPTF